MGATGTPADLAARCAADRAADRGRRWRPDRRRHRGRRPRAWRPSISTSATAWRYALWHRAGKRSAILSGRRAEAVDRRAAELKIAHVLQGPSREGRAVPRLWSAELGLEPRQVCYVGDDLPDLPVLRAVGLAACPADAVAEVRDAAHLVTTAAGGRGAVREVVEVILKSQGLWHGLCGGYSVPAM